MSNQLAIRDDMSLSEMGQILVKSGFFSDSKDAAQAIVKVLAGRELGFGPIASMTGIYVIQGRISMSANILAAAIKRTGRYNFRVRELTDTNCSIEFFEHGESIGTSTFSAKEAQKAGTKNMDRFPRNMLYARAMSNGARWYCPDVFGGPVYTPEELGANVNEEGEVVDAHSVKVVTEQLPVQPLPEEPPAILEEAAALGAVVGELVGAPMTLAEAETVVNSQGVFYKDIATDKLTGMLNALNRKPTRTREEETKMLAAEVLLKHRNGR